MAVESEEFGARSGRPTLSRSGHRLPETMRRPSGLNATLATHPRAR